MRSLLLAASLATVLCATSAQAGFIAYNNSLVPAAQLQNWQGPLGLDFLVNESVTVTALGAFTNGDDANFAGSDGVSGIQVGLWNLTNNSWVVNLTTLTAGNTTAVSGDLGDRFYALSTPIALTVGTTYRLLTTNVKNYNSGGNANPYSTTDGAWGHLTFLENATYENPGYTGDPSGFIGPVGPANRFNSGTFTYEYVPEPGNVALLGMAVTTALVLRRRRAA